MTDRFNKLDDDSLEMVNGGTNKEMREIRDKLGSNNLGEMMDDLQSKGIIPKLSSTEKNEYFDGKTGKSMSHTDVMNKLMGK